ncbi:2TM domain-containing protein [Geodermatophilus nigrescens]|uniref:2TM domain-containing protein n=1 Tax=Geodermatophilus sp. FMUSA9-8 TaxID=3120155 RepID=UPI0030095D0A
MRTDDQHALRASPPDDPRHRARRRALTDHLVVFVAVTTTLWLGWLVVAPALGAWSPWPLAPTVGWGSVLALHARWASSPPCRPADGGRIARQPGGAVRQR